MRFVLCFVVLILAITLNAQDSGDRRRVGMRAGVQTQQIAIQFPIWIGGKLTVGPNLGISTATDSGTDLLVGLSVRKYLSEEQASPFIGLQYSALLSSPPQDLEDVESTVDHIIGVLIGGDYFLSSQFSLGVELQLNYTKSDDRSIRFGTPGGETFNTAAGVNASFYF